MHRSGRGLGLLQVLAVEDALVNDLSLAPELGDANVVQDHLHAGGVSDGLEAKTLLRFEGALVTLFGVEAGGVVTIDLDADPGVIEEGHGEAQAVAGGG